MRRLSTALLLLFCITRVVAQNAPDVTLITTGIADTEREATLNALRSAIEQAFGVFVSANTEILNDELVKDEVVSISRGNIKQYAISSRTDMPNGQVAVTVRSEVSVSNLITYARGKGSTAEFAGQSFAMNVKLMKLKEQNTLKAYQDMCKQVSILLDNAFDYQVKISDPVVTNAVRFRTGSQKSEWLEGIYEVDGQIIVENNEINYQIYKLVDETLASLSLTNTEIQQYVKMGRKGDLISFSPSFGAECYVDMVDKVVYLDDESYYTLPISYKDLWKIDKRILDKLFCSYFNYTVYINEDPLLWISTPPDYEWRNCHHYGDVEDYDSQKKYLTWNDAPLLTYECEYYHKHWGGVMTMVHSAGKSLWDVVRWWSESVRMEKRIRKTMAINEYDIAEAKLFKKMKKEGEEIQRKMSEYRQETSIRYFDIEHLSKFLLTLPLGQFEKLVKCIAPRGTVYEFTESGARQLAACFPLYEVDEIYYEDVLSHQVAMRQEFSLRFMNEDEICEFSGIEIKHN